MKEATGPMKMSRKVAALVAVSAVGALALSACAGESGNKSPKNQLIYGADQYPANWNPHTSAGNSTATENALVQVLPEPFTVTPDFKRQATELVTEEPKEISQNPFTVEYKINPKANWSDGKPIDVKDFIFSWHTNSAAYKPYRDDLGKAACASVDSGYEPIKSITGKDNGKTVDVTFTKPYADWRFLFQNLLPAHAIEKPSAADTCKAFNAGWSGRKVFPFSGGPWKISSVDGTAQTFTEVPNDKYWGTKPKLSKIIYRTVGTDSSSLVDGLQNNEIQMIYPQPQLDLVDQLKKLNGVHTEVNYGLQFEHIDFNMTNQDLKNLKFRQAVLMALDRQEIVKKTIGQFDPSGAKVLGNRALVPGQPGYQDNTPAQYKTRDVAGAKKLLQQAGYTFSGDKLTKNGRQVSLLFTTTTNNALRKSTQEIVQNQLADIGIKVNIKQYPAETFFGALKDQGSLTAGDFDMGLFAWVSSPELNSSNTLAYSCVPGNRRTDGMNNYGLGCDPKAQKMIDGVQTETDQTQIEATWNKIDQQLWTDVFTIPLYQKATVISYSDKYKGIGDNTTLYGPFWNSQTWSRAD